MRTTLQDLLASGKPIVADGAMGTMLLSMGLTGGGTPELWNVEHPEAIRGVHRAYIQAGAQIILTNTFGCNPLRLRLHKLSERAEELNKAAAQLACAEASAAADPVVVAGDIGPTGALLKPYGDLEYEDAVEAFAVQSRALIEGGVDVLWIETMADLQETQAAVEGARRAAADFPVIATLTFDRKGRTMFGVTPEQAAQALAGLDVVAMGGNCGNGPDEIETVIDRMRAFNPASMLIAKANAGAPRLEGQSVVYDATPEMMGQYAIRVRDLGARIIGACCGSTPDHIRAIAEALGVSHG